jgi:hypothetical protein
MQKNRLLRALADLAQISGAVSGCQPLGAIVSVDFGMTNPTDGDQKLFVVPTVT